MITHILTGDYQAAKAWCVAAGALSLLPMIAAAVDLATGIKASKRVGHFHTTSWGLRRTLWKVAKYETLMFMAILLDAAISFVVSFPAICGVVAVCELLTEYVSVKENLRRGRLPGADVDPLSIAKTIASIYGKETGGRIADIITEITKQQAKGND